MARSRPGRGRRRWLRWTAGGAAAILLLVLPLGCSMLSEFKPSIDTPEMRAAGLASRFLDTAEGKMHFVTAGQPAPARGRVLFIHGSPGTWDAWRRWMMEPRLRERAELIAPDRLGFGGSERGDAEASLSRQAESLEAILDADPGPKAVLVGHSLGGPIAARLAVDRPDLVAALLLVAPSIDPALEKRRWYNVAGSLRLVQWFLPVDWTTSNRELWPLKDELAALAPKWESIAVPVVVVQGEEDDLVPAANADFAARMLPGRAEIRRVPGQGHFVLWTQPEVVTGPILELLARAGGAGGP